MNRSLLIIFGIILFLIGFIGNNSPVIGNIFWLLGLTEIISLIMFAGVFLFLWGITGRPILSFVIMLILFFLLILFPLFFLLLFVGGFV